MDFSTELEKLVLETANEKDKLIKKTSISLDESKLFLSVQLKLFKRMEEDYMTGEEKPKYSVFSIDRSYVNNYIGIEKMEQEASEFNTEQDVRNYFNL